MIPVVQAFDQTINRLKNKERNSKSKTVCNFKARETQNKSALKVIIVCDIKVCIVAKA